MHWEGMMEYYIAVFKSRSEAIGFSNMLTRNRVESQIIPTPKESGRTCGLSVEVSKYDFDYAKFLLLSSRFSSFSGWFYCKQNGENRIVVRV